MSKKLSQPKTKSKLDNVIFWLAILIILWRVVSSVNWSNAINEVVSFVNQYSVVVVGLCSIGLITLGALLLVIRRTNAKYDALYDEMRSSLRSVMIPLGFKEKKSEGYMRHPTVSFSKGKTSVVLNQERIAHCVTGSSKESLEERQARIDNLKARSDNLNDKEFLDEMKKLANEENDFEVRGDITDSKFKDNVLAELNKWLFRKGIR